MTDDIVKLAALRQQRRPKTGRSGETTLFKNDNSTQPDDSGGISEPPDLLPVESPRPRGMRQRQNSPSDIDGVISSEENRTPLPFICCKISDFDVKCLINTAAKQSLISRDVCYKIRGVTSEGRRQMHRIVLTLAADIQASVNLEVQDDIPDIVLGIDFLTQFKKRFGNGSDLRKPVCELSFKERTLLIGREEAAIIPFLPEADIPLKFRVHRSLAASF